MRMRALLCAVAVAGLVAGFGPARAATGPTILMSNFRFCPDRPIPCDPADVGYASSPVDPTPLAQQYSPVTTVSVKPGDVVTWTYADTACDTIMICPGHNVVFTDASLQSSTGKTLGKTTITFTVPDLPAGTVLPYYCTLHYPFGMNGALQIAG